MKKMGILFLSCVFLMSACNTAESEDDRNAEETGEADSPEEETAEESAGADSAEKSGEMNEAPPEITIEKIAQEQEGTMIDRPNEEIEDEFQTFIEEKGAENVTATDLYDKLLELLGGHPAIIEGIEFYNGFSTGLGVDLTDQPGGLEVTGDNEVLFHNNIYILLDNSGSMAAEIDGRLKMDIARDAVDTFVADMPEGTNVSLINYGQAGKEGTDDGSCSSIEVSYPMDAYDEAAFNDALNKFEPVGFTPIAAAIEEVGRLIDESGDVGSHIVYIVSDGRETCNEDPVAAVNKLPQDETVETVLNIIGFDIADDEIQSLVDITEESGGKFISAENQKELNDVMAQEKMKLINQWREWSVQNLNNMNSAFTGKITEKNQIHTSGLHNSNQMHTKMSQVFNQVSLNMPDADLPSPKDYLNEHHKVILEFYNKKNDASQEGTTETYEERRAEIEQLIEGKEEEYQDEQAE